LGGDWASRKILPPYLGEMGLEIRSFLAAVEPWLRNGWRIPARRPALYPAGSAFADPALFAELDEALRASGARPMVATVSFADGTGGAASRVTAALQGAELRVEIANDRPEDLGRLLRTARLERDLRRIFARHHLRRPRPLTPWDSLLTACLDGDPAQWVAGAAAMAPSYRPDAFVVPRHAAAPHVGVQLRALPADPGRDSEPELVMPAAMAAAAHLGLPLLVYGHPGGTLRPAGHACTMATATALGCDLLEFELAMLTQCRVMFAPDSGWCDLMCWLGVPTLLEQQCMAFSFAAMHVFRPRLQLHDRSQPTAPQVDRLLAQTERLPDPRAARLHESFWDWDGAWMRRQIDTFLNEGFSAPASSDHLCPAGTRRDRATTAIGAGVA
jgi:hypothetical protein